MTNRRVHNESEWGGVLIKCLAIRPHRLVLDSGENSSSASRISREGSSSLSLLVTREYALLAMETKFLLGEDSGQEFTQIIPDPAGVTLPKLGNFTQAW